MSDSDKPKPKGDSVQPQTVPITGVNVPDPTTGSELKSETPIEGETGHEAFEKTEAESEKRDGF